MIEETEQWRPVVGYEGLYEVSDHGRVRSLDRTVRIVRRNRWSKEEEIVFARLRGQLLKPWASKAGHLSVGITRTVHRLVHHLVLEAFVGPCPAGHEGLHGDDIPSNNHLSNLRWGTRAENIADAFANGGLKRGAGWHTSKLADDDVRLIRRLLRRHTMADLARRFGISAATIGAIRDRKRWGHVSDRKPEGEPVYTRIIWPERAARVFPGRTE